MSATASTIQPLHASQPQLLGVYLPAMRQRFKNEINRLTSGAIADRHGKRSEGG